MKKNLLIAVLLLLTVSSVWAKDYNVETKKFKSWGEAQFDAETATITFTKNWQGGGWWLSRLDCSAYDCIVIEFEEALPMDVMFMATYSAKDDKDQKIKSKVKVPAGKKNFILYLFLKIARCCKSTVTSQTLMYYCRTAIFITSTGERKAFAKKCRLSCLSDGNNECT